MVTAFRANVGRLQGSGIPARRRPRRDRACRRAGAGHHAARHDPGLRRLPHLDPRRARRARLRHRRERGRRTCSPRRRSGRSGRRRCASSSTAACADGVDAKDVILAIIAHDRRRRRASATSIEYAGCAIARDVDRGAAARSATCRSRPARAPAWSRPTRRPSPTSRAGRCAPKGERWDAARRVLEDAADRRRRASSIARSRSTRRSIAADGHLGHEPRARAADQRRRARPERDRRRRAAREHGSGAALHGPRRRDAAARRRRSTACSSARAPTAASRTCAPRPRGRARRASAIGPGAGRARARRSVKRAGRGRRARPRLPRGGLRVARVPAARCASA